MWSSSPRPGVVYPPLLFCPNTQVHELQVTYYNAFIDNTSQNLCQYIIITYMNNVLVVILLGSELG